MPEIQRLTVRPCPICRVTMVHTDFGWSCPQCGSAIVEPSRREPEPGREGPEQSTRGPAGGALGG